jgi:hypothetical protein
MRSPTVACDLCELHTDVAWVIRTDKFTVLVGDEPHFYPEGDEWGLCRNCRDDVLADDQAPILARRHAALIRDTHPADWARMPKADQAAVFQILDLVVLTALACRQKAYGRAWTAEDEREALEQLREDGGRGLRR